MKNLLHVALAQIAPVWLNKKATIAKIESTILEAAKKGSELIVFGEALLPGYPFWLAYTCLLYTSPSPRDRTRSRMPSSA